MLSLLEMSLFGGVLIAAVVILRAAVGQRLPRWAFLVLWGVALVRLLIPFSLPSPTSVYRGLDALEPAIRRAGIAAGGETSAVEVVEQAGTAATDPSVLALVWGGAAVGLALFFLLTHLRGRRDYRASLPVEDPFVVQWLAEHPLRRTVQVRVSDRIDTPLTYGILRPVILLPKGLDRSGQDRLAFVLAHEMAHVRRCDALTKCLLCAAVCVHWFNPLVWVMLLLAGRDLEVSCDQTVVRMYGPAARGPYARTLLDLEAKRTRFLPLASGFSRNALEERIGAIMKSRKFTVTALVAAVAVVMAVTAVFATSAPRDKTPESTSTANSSLAQVDRMLGTSGISVKEDGSATFFGMGDGGDLKIDPETGHYYTKAQYDQVAALKTEGYEKLSIAEFNRTLYAAVNSAGEDEEEAFWWTWELVLSEIPKDDPLAPFLLNTAQASLTEYNVRLNEVYLGQEYDPCFYGEISRTETANVYGDVIEVGWTECSYRFCYRILDQNGLTVGERDAFLQSILDGMQAWLDGLDAEKLTDRDSMKQAVQTELDRLGQAASTAEITYTEGTVTDYYSDRGYDGSYYGSNTAIVGHIRTVTEDRT